MYMQSEAQWKSGKSRKAIQGQASKDSVSKRRNAVPVIGGVFPSYKLKDALFGNGAVIQRVKFSDTTWAPEGEEGENAPFTLAEKKMMEEGLQKARGQLGKAKRYLWIRLGQETPRYLLGINLICDALDKVYEVLSDEKLEIFPITNPGIYGQAAIGAKEISINISNHSNDNDVAKTLLHETFHIIGGGYKYTEFGDSGSKDSALSNIKGKKSIDAMNADSFAQFVMKC